ncbi:ATP-dependent nuclease [Paenibacillus taiwanensis]|uniref:ATP-dependent nuclease n=1 Tax=Paenibacillus taiwanensis TaxID=401638 RepID=UPI0003FEC04E|nr:AAA family ATPase [Paenibacillus taiwanensis]
MKMKKLYIRNYKMFKDVLIKLNSGCNIFVGDNNSGKSTLLEIIQVLLSGRINNSSFERQFKASFFNYESRFNFKEIIADPSQKIEELPSIVVEAYFENDGNNSGYKGTNNEFGEDCPGIRMSVEFNPDYSLAFQTMLENGEIYDIPVEFYKVSWRDFGDNPIIFRTFPVKVSLIDTTQKDYDSAVNKFINSRITNNLSDDEKVHLTRAYRKMKHEFNNNPNVLALNERLAVEEKLDDKAIKFGMQEDVLESWMNEVSIEVENIPFEDMGFGTQNLIKMELVFKQDTEKSNIVLFEEPENNLAFGNMSRLISKINQDENKQVFISTHSSFVANKLGLKNIILLYKGNANQLDAVTPDTMDFFKKLPGYGTVRFLLAEKVILVEGPTDELIIQRAYKDVHGKLPIENGVDVITVDSLAFKRYCDLAILVRKPLRIITDNDGDVQRNIIDKYKEYIKAHSDLIAIDYETNETLHTLEPSVLAVNSVEEEVFKKFKRVISKGNSMVKKNVTEIESFMLNNKAEWGMRVFDSDECIEYPAYIKNAIR